METEAISALIGAASAVISGAALLVSLRIHAEQKRLTEKIHVEQIRLSQRQFLLELYHEIKLLDEVPSTAAPRENVQKAVNTLELIGVAVEGGMVDRDVVRRLFRETFVLLYGQIDATAEVPGLKKTGKQLLADVHSARRLYKEFQEERELATRPAPLTAGKT